MIESFACAETRDLFKGERVARFVNIQAVAIRKLQQLHAAQTLSLSYSMSRKVPLAHPGVILNEDWLKPLGLSQYALARAISVPPRRINEIVKGLRGITVDTALRFAAFFGTDAKSWINLQTHYDIEIAREAMSEVLAHIVQYDAAPVKRISKK